MLIRTLPLLFLTLAAVGCATAQRDGQELAELRKRDREELATARSFIDLEQFDRALPPLAKLLERYPRAYDLYYLRALAHQGRNDYTASIADLNNGLQFDATDNPTVQSMLGRNYAVIQDYGAARTAYTNYLALLRKRGAKPDRIARAERLIAEVEFAAELVASPVPFEPRALSGGINTEEYPEYFPSLSVDGQRMIFTRRLPATGEDFFVSERTPEGNWSEAERLRGVNTPLNEGAQTITATENYLIFTGCDRPGGVGSCDLYYSQKVEGRWTEARNLGPSINTRWRETQPSLSTDGKLLFFSSNREGGSGKHDLYVAGRLPDGSWSQPVNLGPTINTTADDLFPFWAADNRTLFFTSTGRPGMGGADLFKSSVNASNEWEEPVNLGYPINTAAEETNIFVALDGKTAYFSKGETRVGGGTDVNIYAFELPEPVRPASATYVAVNVTDARTGEPLEADVRVTPRTAGASTVVQRTNPAGYFITVLASGADYGFTVEREGYLFYSDQFVLSETTTPTEPYRLNLNLQPIDGGGEVTGAESDGAIALRNVFFATGSDELLGVSGEELDRLVQVLADRPALRIEIAGHTDDVGDAAANQSLSERRAAAVKTYLIQQGISEDRIQTVGYGEERPVATNETAEGRAENRRTTFRLLR